MKSLHQTMYDIKTGQHGGAAEAQQWLNILKINTEKG